MFDRDGDTAKPPANLPSHESPVASAQDQYAPLVDQPVAFSVTRQPARTPDRFSSLLSFAALLALLSFFLPYTIEKMTYSFLRGRQRAMYDTAGEKLKNVALKDLSDAYQLVANRVGPSVVHINVATRSNRAERHQLRPGWTHPSTSQGSGIIVDADGYIVTNAHVIEDHANIIVKMSDGQRLEADVVGVDKATDVAVLKIEASDLMPAEWGNSDDLDLGAMVWALGSPLGLQRSVTFGIVSGKNRSFSSQQPFGNLDAQGISRDSHYHNFLQTDAAVNPGNSGGPLVDSQGNVVGINTAIIGEAYQGISFAIPSSIARPIYERIKSTGRVVRGYLGVGPEDVTVELAKRLELPEVSGAFIAEVRPDIDGIETPAHRAGIQVGDVVLSWAGKPVTGRNSLFSLVGLTPVGSTVEVVVWRENQQKRLAVSVAKRTPGT